MDHKYQTVLGASAPVTNKITFHVFALLDILPLSMPHPVPGFDFFWTPPPNTQAALHQDLLLVTVPGCT